MEQFKFSLQKLLEIRIDKEEKSKRNFVEAQRQKQIVKDKLDILKDSYEKHKTFDINKTVVQHKIKNNYLNALSFGIDEANKELEKKQKLVEEKREKLKQDQIERKTVEILKDNKQLAFISEQNRIEQATNDEFALYSFLRNLKGRER